MVHGRGWASTKVELVLAKGLETLGREPNRELLTMFGLELQRKAGYLQG